MSDVTGVTPCPVLDCRYPVEDHNRKAHIYAGNKAVLDEEMKLGLRLSPEEAARLAVAHSEAARLVSGADPDERGLLTANEHEAMALLGRFAQAWSGIVGDGATRAQDINEAIAHVHALQNMVLSQAAARAYPGRYRLAGGTCG